MGRFTLLTEAENIRICYDCTQHCLGHMLGNIYSVDQYITGKIHEGVEEIYEAIRGDLFIV